MTTFLEDLEIEVLGSGRLWRSADPAALNDKDKPQGPSANVVAASLVTFVDGLTRQQKEDVLNSTLLAQLGANRHHDRQRDLPGWYVFYRKVLTEVGWRTQTAGSSSRDTRVPTPTLRFTPDAAVLRLLQPVARADELVIAQATLTRFHQLPDRDRRVVIFESNAHGSGNGNFQIVSVKPAPQGSVLMTIAAFYFHTAEPVTRLLTFPFGKRTTQMFQARHILALDPEAYAKVRQQVIDQLGDQASALIDDLPL